MRKPDREAIAVAMTALSHPRRVAIFERLSLEAPQGLTFDQLLTATGLSVSTLSHHLRPMRVAGLVSATRKGQRVFHRVRPDVLRPALRKLGLSPDC